MKDAQRLLDVLKETLRHQEQVCQCMQEHKRLLIEGKDMAVPSMLEAIEQHSSAVIQLEHTRQEIVGKIALDAGVEAQTLTADTLLRLPALLSVREELQKITAQLRGVLQDIVQLRDEIQALAQHAKAYSEMFLAALQQSISKSNSYGVLPALGSRFISVLT
ncbi:flagellar export chaperone FlgN [Alicyclobacillus fodiniaquatilis]|jgi:hypothetical protein|uniref:Flagellar export chaperone FlgN n=1 Tax=Alicyclobacillus fodiniaquatilis TaxID=1661150 RepID=A0ABW4JK55_9BACL